MGLLKSHLTECRPLELIITVKRSAPIQRQFYTMPVTVNAETFRKALEFLIAHNYSFDGRQSAEDVE